jgi:carbonic anhydrase/acetyltransferase-like protein (isoleucine patch superfamily)
VLYRYLDYEPEIAPDVFLAPGVHIIGRVKIGEGSSIWFNSVARGDVNQITIGRNTNIQDNATVHVDDKYPTVIGDHVLVGHKAILHGCTVEDGSMIGMGAILLDGSHVEKNAMVGAGSLVRQGDRIPAGMLAIGTPAKVVRELKTKEIARIHEMVQIYADRAKMYTKSLRPIE